MKKLLFALLIFVSLASCSKKPELLIPPDYKLRCDFKGHYVAETPDGYFLTTSDGAYKSKKKAIERAWEDYNYKVKSDSLTAEMGKWRVCQEWGTLTPFEGE